MTDGVTRRSVLAVHGDTLRRVLGYVMQRENAALLVCRGSQVVDGHHVLAAQVFGLSLAQQALVAAVVNSDGRGVRPLLLGGDAGSGKSTVLGHVARTCVEMIPAARVIHQVATGCSLHATLTELWLALDHSSAPPLAEQELCAAMPAMLVRAVARLQPLVIFLDGMDQLDAGAIAVTSQADRAEGWIRRAMRWVPSPLPAGLRLVCTVSTTCPGWDTIASEQVPVEHTSLRPGVSKEATTAAAEKTHKWVVGTVAPLSPDASLLLAREWATALGPGRSSVDHSSEPIRWETLALRANNPFQLRLQLARNLQSVQCSMPMDGVAADDEGAMVALLKSFEVRIGESSARGCIQLLRFAGAWGLEEEDLYAVLTRRGLQASLGAGVQARSLVPQVDLFLEMVQRDESSAPRVRLCCSSLVQQVVETRYGQTDTPEAISWLEALSNHLDVTTASNIEDRATLLLPLLHTLAVHATQQGDDDSVTQTHEALRQAAFDPSVVCWLLERGRTEALLQYCLSSGGYDVVCEYILSLPPSLTADQAETNELILSLGRLLSAAGQYRPARELLQSVLTKLQPQDGTVLDEESTNEMRGRLQLALAENEVRYWDSRRDWSSESDLELLLSSSAEAVTLLRRTDELRGRGASLSDIPLRTGRMGPMKSGHGSTTTRLWLCDALSRCANAHFKAGCVLTGAAATDHFSSADNMTDEIEYLIGSQSGFAPTETLAGAVLVSGVTMSCRAHLLEREGGERDAVAGLVHRAVQLFLRAESMLVECVGEFNEKSIYTHSNLAEIHLYDLGNLRQGLEHLRQSSKVADRTLGVEHPNTQAKHAQLQRVQTEVRALMHPAELQQLGLDV